MADLKTRKVVKGTLKVLAKGTVKVARGTVKVADLSLKTANRTLSVTSKGIKTGQTAVDSKDEKSFTDYAERRTMEAAARGAAKINRTGKRAVRGTWRNIRWGTLNPVRTLKRGSSGLKTAAAEVQNANTAMKAAQRASAPQARAMLRKAQKRSWRAAKDMAKAIGKTVKAAVKAVGDMLALLFGGAWILLLVVVFIVLGGAALALNSSSTGEIPAREYSETETAVYYFLRGKMGLNSAAACGVMANINAESGFNFKILGDEGTSYGLCQWHKERWDRLKSFCAQHGFSSDTLQGQLHYLQWELENCFPDVLYALQNVDDDEFGCFDAAAYFCIHFENPDQAQKRAEERGLGSMKSFWISYGNTNTSVEGMKLAITAYMELGNDGGEKYWRWYGWKEHVDWCAWFGSWCGNECGYIDEGRFPKYSGCPWGEYYFKHQYTWYDRSVLPEPGWVIFFDWNRGETPLDTVSDHTGIVFKVDNGIIYTVEGNAYDNVMVMERDPNSIEILGYGVPDYTS